MTNDRGKIIFRGHKGNLIENGIFLFEENFYLDINKTYGCEFAVLGDMFFQGWLSSTVDVTYITFEKEKYAILKQWERFSEGKHYYEFKNATEQKSAWTVLDERFFSELKSQSEIREKKLSEIVIDIEPEAKELVQGLGYRNIELKFVSPLFKEIPYTCYPAAYRDGDKLVLINVDKDYKLVKKKFDMRLMSLLVVRNQMDTGSKKKHEAYYPIIDKENQIWQELLTKEMYEEYLKWDMNMQIGM